MPWQSARAYTFDGRIGSAATNPAPKFPHGKSLFTTMLLGVTFTHCPSGKPSAAGAADAEASYNQGKRGATSTIAAKTPSVTARRHPSPGGAVLIQRTKVKTQCFIDRTPGFLSAGSD
jgi:hypothetical protein